VQDVEIVTVPSAINASEAFKSGQVDAAVVWSPDDGTCVRTVAGSKVLINTKQATHIIADGFMVKQSVFNQKKDQFAKLVKGWMIGAQELNESDSKKKEAAKYMSAAFEGISENDAYNSINNVRLANM
jgi:NitT/TauT family transport system substrate-binding protein